MPASQYEVDLDGPAGPDLVEALCSVAAEAGAKIVRVVSGPTLIVTLDREISQARIVERLAGVA